MPVNSHIFGEDPCPGTRKYVEVHFACIDSRLSSGLKSLKPPSTKPPWLKTSEEIWGTDYSDENVDDRHLDYDDAYDGDAGDGGLDYGLEPRIPILPEESSSPVLTTISPARIPITTPKVVSTTTTTPAPTTATDLRSQNEYGLHEGRKTFWSESELKTSRRYSLCVSVSLVINMPF